jgi:hypothetical protein
MRELIKQVLEETIQKKYSRLTPDQYDKVYKLIGSIFKGFEVEMDPTHKNLNIYHIKFCRNGKQVGHFGGGNTDKIYANLTVDEKIVKQIQSVFNIRKLMVLNLITEYFEDNLLGDMSKEIGIQFTDLDDVREYDFRKDCDSVLDKGRPDLSRDKMIEYITSNTLFRKGYLENKQNHEILQLYKDAWRKVKREELGQ